MALRRRQGKVLFHIGQRISQRHQSATAREAGSPHHPVRTKRPHKLRDECMGVRPRVSLLRGNLVVANLGVHTRKVGKAQDWVERCVGRRLGDIRLADVVDDDAHTRMPRDHAGKGLTVTRPHVELQDCPGFASNLPEGIVLRRIDPPRATLVTIVEQRMEPHPGSPRAIQ